MSFNTHLIIKFKFYKTNNLIEPNKYLHNLIKKMIEEFSKIMNMTTHYEIGILHLKFHPHMVLLFILFLIKLKKKNLLIDFIIFVNFIQT